MPPVDHIRRFEVDPYTLQVESDKLSASEDDEVKHEGPDMKLKTIVQPYGWKIRKPDKPNQTTLKTGYEPIIAQRVAKQQNASAEIQID